MIIQSQIKKALDMRNGSGMSWVAIADVIDEDLEELVRAVEKAWGKPIPRESWGVPRGAGHGKAVGAAAPRLNPVAMVSDPRSEKVEGFEVVFDAGPPPPKLGDGRLAVLAQRLRPGAMVKGMSHSEFLSLRRFLSRLGMGSEFRWTDKAKGIVTAYVLAEPSARQKSMSALMKAKAAGGGAVGRPAKGGKKRK